MSDVTYYTPDEDLWGTCTWPTLITHITPRQRVMYGALDSLRRPHWSVTSDEADAYLLNIALYLDRKYGNTIHNYNDDVDYWLNHRHQSHELGLIAWALNQDLAAYDLTH